MKLKVIEITGAFEAVAPLSLQESYDNSGLQIGSPDQEISSALITVDVTEKVVDEAVKTGAGLIITHHPLIFNGMKKITCNSEIGRSVIKAIRNNIAVYAAHTNFDSVDTGVNRIIGEKLGLMNLKVLKPAQGLLKKLAVYVPVNFIDSVRNAIFEAGAGHIGNYDMCSFNVEGLGSFRGSDEATPFTGEKNKLHFEKEIRIETIFPSYTQKKVVEALLNAHPYEEVAFDISPLDNDFDKVGMGMTGELPSPVGEILFMEKIKHVFNCKSIKYTNLKGLGIRKVALCGGSGAFLLREAISAGADIFISSDFKYHQFFEAEGRIVIADIGHYESEQFTKELFYELLTKKFPTFAVRLSEVITNPVNFL